MPLIHENDPDVINDDVLRACIEFEPGADQIEEKRKVIAFSAVKSLNVSFRNLRRIDNLQGLLALTKLQLDNNGITKIENIDHLTNLTWLDLSFNKIAKIEGLSTLTKLTDLTLLSNRIEKLENLDSLAHLNVLSMGNNQIKELRQVMYLRRFKNLKLLNLAGNPISKNPEYKNYILSHTLTLKFLDCRLVDPASVQAAKEQYQDEMLELEEREENERQEEAGRAERARREAELAAANLAGIEGLFDAMLAGDPEQGKLQQVATLLDGIGEMRDSWLQYSTEFVENSQREHKAKVAEHAWKEALDALIASREAESREIIAVSERSFAHLRGNALQAVREGQDELVSQAVTALRKLRNEDMDELQDRLLAVESSTVDAIGELVSEFDRNYTELVDGSKGTIAAFFTQVRDLEHGYYDRVMQQAAQLIERAAATAEAEDGGGFTDDARGVLQDKEGLNNSLQASHDSHLSAIDGAEDRLVSEEARRYTTLLSDTRAWENQRNRDRVSEIMGLVERTRDRVDGVLAELEATNTAAA